jgi:hypothetical protein
LTHVTRPATQNRQKAISYHQHKGWLLEAKFRRRASFVPYGGRLFFLCIERRKWMA